MNGSVLVTDFSGVYQAQGFLQQLPVLGADVCRLDFRQLEGTCCYCDPSALEQMAAALPETLPRLRWLDSGDYHYMSHLLALRESRPFRLVLLDHHSDRQTPAFGDDLLSCGSWVKAMEERNPMLREVVTIGPPGYPQQLDPDWLERNRGERVYVSLDKDVMDPAFARTDWSQGSHSLPAVTALLEQLFICTEVVAVDICGEKVPAKGATLEDLCINYETNIELYKFITNHFK